VTVSLSGDGGDELFCGYAHRYVGQARKLRWIQAVPAAFRRVGASVLGTAAQGLSSLPVDARERLSRVAKPRLLDEQLGRTARMLRKPNAEEMSTCLLAGSFAANLLRADLHAGLGPLDPLRHVRIDRATDLVSWMMVHDQLNYMPEDILVKVDRASMAVSLEARVPLLDNRVVDFAWRLPHRLKLADGVTKRICRLVLARHVPLNLFERPKSGFSVPIDTWLRGGLRAWASDLLDPSSVARYALLDVAGVEQLWQRFQDGLPAMGGKVWTVVMLQAWLEQWA
jgi:asparagine synthase (glutamine-hydrolysing)